MFAPDDTIVAIATPPGRGGIGVVRLSGPRARDVAAAILTREAPLEPRRATLTRVRTCPHRAGLEAHPGIVDQVVATSFPAPHSFTGQDVVEVSAHGSPVVLSAIVRAATDAGARLARPGEFTLRAFLNGKLDLIQAEAVGDLIASATPLQARVAFDQLEGTLTARIAGIDARLFDLIARLEASLDFPDEGFHFIEPAQATSEIEALIAAVDALLGDANRGRMIREGATVVIAGRPNVGKSSLFNALVGASRAIVTDVPGTTRDLVTERVDLEGLALTLVDTAGSRASADVVEREGVARAARAREVADLLLVVVDGSEALTAEDRALIESARETTHLLVASKSDRPAAHEMGLRVSAVRGDGLSELRRAIVAALTGGDTGKEAAAVTNQRHVRLLETARHRMASALESATSGAPEEFLVADLQAARECFDEIVGTRTSEDVLRHIFERFCIGK